MAIDDSETTVNTATDLPACKAVHWAIYLKKNDTWDFHNLGY